MSQGNTMETMTGRERFLAALACRQPDHVPLWEIEFHLFDRYADRPLVLGKAFAALNAAEQEQALRQNAETMVEVAKQLGHSALTCPGGYWEVAPGVAAYFWLPGDAPWRQLACLRSAAGDQLAVVVFISGMIMPPVTAESYQSFCYRLFDVPEEIDREAAATLSAGLEEARRARDLGADAVCDACDIADSHNVFFSPVQMERFWYPYFHEWTHKVKAMGLYSILHSDGNLTSILDALANSGLHALQAIDPTAGMDIVATRAQVKGKLCLCGNMDLRLLAGGPEEAIVNETKRICLACKPGGGFILGATNAMFKEIPPAHYAAMLKAWKEYGGYP